jgi:hypothetical protein
MHYRRGGYNEMVCPGKYHHGWRKSLKECSDKLFLDVTHLCRRSPSPSGPSVKIHIWNHPYTLSLLQDSYLYNRIVIIWLKITMSLQK